MVEHSSFSHMLFVHESFVKQVSVLKKGEAQVCGNHCMEEGFSWRMEAR